MFNFLKEKLNSAVSVFVKKVKKEVEEEELPPEKKKKIPEKKGVKYKKKEKVKEVKEKILEEKKEEEKVSLFGKIKNLIVKEEKEVEKGKEAKKEITPQKKETKEKVSEAETEKEKSFFGKITDVFTTKVLSEQKFEELFWDLEITLMENNVALSIIEKIKEDMKNELVNKRIKRGEIDKIIFETLRRSIDEILTQEKVNLLKQIKLKKPYVVCFFGINGSGKTTTIAKIAYFLKKNGISVVLAAADTFRAAAIDQLDKHGEKIGVKVIKQNYGADAAAVAYDAIQYANAHHIDVVLIDTAGRSHSNINLMDELQKIVRVAKPDLKIFVGDSLTGNDMVEQAQIYNEKIGIDGIVLAKADVDEKGGATISVSYVTHKPIYFLGVGQKYEDLISFDKKEIMEKMGF
ncbi:MAG: signal recognition particle-docking protein FtsY [Candidatus Woesearchaeota archaeon]